MKMLSRGGVGIREEFGGEGAIRRRRLTSGGPLVWVEDAGSEGSGGEGLDW